MSDLGYMIWFIATALMIIAVLTIGTLAAAGILGGRERPDEDTAATASSEGSSHRAAEQETSRAA